MMRSKLLSLQIKTSGYCKIIVEDELYSFRNKKAILYKLQLTSKKILDLCL